MIKIGLFYDGNFLLHSSNYYNYIHPEKRRLSINGFHNFIRHRIATQIDDDINNCIIVQSHYFRGRLNAAEAAARENQLYNDRVFDDVLMAEGVHTHYLPLRNVQGKREERGIDVWLSLEALELAIKKEIDIAVLVIADTDYVPLLRKLTAEGIHTMVIGWDFEYIADNGQRMATHTSNELMSIADYPVAMHDVIEEGLSCNDPIITNIFVPTENMSVDENEVFTSEVLSLKNGFGFIKYPNNNLFFHSLDVIGDFTELEINDSVEFTMQKNPQKQFVAKNVRKLN